MDRKIEWLLEQLDAANNVIHTYKCVSCQMASAQNVILIIQDDPPNARVTIVGICDTCGKEEE